MSMTISGLGSGLPIDEWVAKLVAIKQKEIDAISTQKTTLTSSSSALSTVKSSYSSLLSSLQVITDATFGSTTSAFAQNKVTSSDATSVSASVTSLAAKQSLSVFVSQLATSTEAKSASCVAGKIDRDTKFSSLASGAATAGTMSIYVDDQKFSIAVDANDTIGGVLDKISGQTGLWAGVKDGKIILADAEPLEGVTPSSAKNIVVGSTSDTTNFAAITALKKNAEGAFQSNQSILKVSTSAPLAGAGGGFSQVITEGSFKIGDATFVVGATTTLSSLLSEINASDKAGVRAAWDSTSGKMVLSSKTQGAMNINIENIAGNFTDVMGLTSSTFDLGGNILTSKIATGSQTLGNVAIMKINGSEIISQSNTVTSDVTGIAGLTLTLNAKSIGTNSATLTIGADNTALNTALTSFISKFNTVLSQSDSVTANDGYLHGETSLNMIRNNLRQTVTSSVTGQSGYTSLSSIGITTGAVGSSISADTDQIQLDATKLAEALAANPEAVKQLLIGDGTNEGVFTKLQKQVSSSLDPMSGFFVARAKTFDAQITDLTSTISKRTDDLAVYKSATQAKFNLMDQMIASMQGQFSNISALIGKK